MKVKKYFSHKDGEAYIRKHFPTLLQEVEDAVSQENIATHKTKVTKETGKRFTPGQMLYSPKSMNKALAANLRAKGWNPSRIAMVSPTDEKHAGFREMDGLKDELGLEIQFGKYAFALYDILGKMPIFAGRGLIRAGIELVPMKELVAEMSSGVSYFEQVTADLKERGAADKDVPTLVLGIGFKTTPAGVLAPSDMVEPDPTGLEGGEEDLES